MKRLSLMLAIIGASACAKDLLDSGRFACSTDADCLEGWSCAHPLEECVASSVPRSIAVGRAHYCVVDAVGNLTCEGSNQDFNPSAHAGQATVPSDLGPVTKVVAGDNHTCVMLEANRHVRCFGSNTHWIPGGGTFTSTPTFQSKVPEDLGPVIDLDAKALSTCVLRDGTPLCWGEHQTPDDPPSHSDFLNISAAAWHACGIRKGGETVCWGTDLGGSTRAPKEKLSRLAGGFFHTCGLTPSGSVVCWGHDTDEMNRTNPPRDSMTGLAIGHFLSCGIRSDARIACWGRHPLNEKDVGEAYPPQGRFIFMSGGNRGACAVRIDGEIVCWGLTDDP